ncbi:MAG: prephenate dehydrogenase/arogenate dehydrogenase family protein [Deltaproteobacteria bacterium]|nr:prephenate dehydrogenase/arogenate dehydrogenase family protein [Deltaproteobacteria bacterium]
MAEQFGRAAIVGLGLKGGSLAMVLRKKRLVKEVIGIDTDATALTKALHRDIVDQAVGDLEQGLSQADLVVLAVPTHSTADVLADIPSHLQVGAVVCDLGRIKGPVLAKAAEVLPQENPFVGCHPVVFEEEKDIDEAYPALFQDRPCILTSGDRRDEEAVKKIREVWEAAGSKVEEMDPEVHDRLFAVLEDLPILFLNLVCKAAGQVSGYVDEIDDYSSQELKEITRLVSKVSPHAAERLWANRKPLVHVLAYYRLKLKELSEALQEGSLQDLKALL